MSPVEKAREIYRGHLEEILERTPPAIHLRLARFLDHESGTVADAFLQVLRGLEGTGEYLACEGAATRIREGVERWLRTLLPPREEARLLEHLKRQMEIGRLHARMELPLHLLNTGVRILKQQVHRRLREQAGDIGDYYRLETAIDMMIDVTASLMGECYAGALADEERQLRALQFHLSGQDLALECERIKARA